MRLQQRVFLFVALVIWAGFAQISEAAPAGIINPEFPYCKCKAAPSAYKLDNNARFQGNNTYCFTVDTKAECHVPGVVMSASLNGVRTQRRPTLERAPQQSTNRSAILKLTALGLNLANTDGAEICITLGTNRAGSGCTTMEQFTSANVDVTTAAACFSASPTSYTATTATVAIVHVATTITATVGMRYFINHTVEVNIGGGLGDDPHICFTGNARAVCNDLVSFPSCNCTRLERAAPLEAVPRYTTRPGRKSSTALHCFSFPKFDAEEAAASCANFTTLHKIEFWANETLRRHLKYIGVRPGDARDMTFRSPSWGPTGSNTAKATSLDWTFQQAYGAEICLELQSNILLNEFCQGPRFNYCYLAILDMASKCCPIYAVAITDDALLGSSK
ncbi:extracellular matrix glycoprotein pherophorin-V22 [Volvox carteri f. nagariensis]|uniref:Extracellular matrix glycoprotein pherophorin-V22 n=1 Tax=Volvox carteri f. nagariensis TaxID=3068 RepID=D8U598_VOLCA|nr:extracellular matrix glycoprotein pherophorin-V22 [Volvox carteri f. nagariensis]EFJ45176.1 extracellular matrix glycoprotein pherophorin-V22 [Volvox carteri f. nagariensis]|eukprot:XP_002953852.1 extracellular matrix glycoprotein pherophorin-V22 [Volvox carteri f. nagariensis]